MLAHFLTQRALQICIALTFVQAALVLFMSTLPRALFIGEPPLYIPSGVLYEIYFVADRIKGPVVSLIIAALIPLAILPKDPGRAVLAAALALSGLIALVAPLVIVLRPFTLLGVALEEPTQYQIMYILYFMPYFITYLGLIAALILHHPRRSAGRGGGALLLGAVAFGFMAQLFYLPFDLPRLFFLRFLLSLITALTPIFIFTLWRSGTLPRRAHPWGFAIALFWGLPFALVKLPRLGEALMIDDIPSRYSALIEAFLPDEGIIFSFYGNPTAALLVMGTLAALRFPHLQLKMNRIIPFLLMALATPLQLGSMLGVYPMSPFWVPEPLRALLYSQGNTFLVFLPTFLWCISAITPFVLTVAAGWLWLHGSLEAKEKVAEA